MTTSPLATPTATRELLERYGLATKHRLGQNLLVDGHVVERIMALAALEGAERVVEVGPGIGTLTLALVQEAAAVLAIEADDALEPVLESHAVRHGNLSYLMGDALRVEPERMAAELGGAPDLLIANLPYNVAATLILQYFEQLPSLRAAVVMVQKEVADRIAAAPGTKAYGAYTVKLSLYGRVTGRFEVPPRCFMPAPHVDSAVVRIDRTVSAPALGASALEPGELACVRAVVDAAFAQRRKTIRNSMGANGYDKAALDAAFAACDIAPTARAETLSTSDFIQLAAAL